MFGWVITALGRIVPLTKTLTAIGPAFELPPGPFHVVALGMETAPAGDMRYSHSTKTLYLHSKL